MPRTKNPRKDWDYQPGEEVYLTYGGSRFKVQVLSNFSGHDANGRPMPGIGHSGYELRIVEVIEIKDKAFFRVPPTIGLEFSVEKLSNLACAGSEWKISSNP